MLHLGAHGERRPDENEFLVLSFPAPPRMFVFGAIDFARAVADMGVFLGFHTNPGQGGREIARVRRLARQHLVQQHPQRIHVAAPVDLPGERLVASARFDAPAQVSTIDGLRVDWPDGFGLIRASNTTPVLVLRFEGQTEAALHRIEADMLALLRSVKPDAQIGAAAH